MPIVHDTRVQHIRRTIRDAVVIDPLITITELTGMIEKKFNHTFDPRYITKLAKKVSGEIIVRTDTQSIEKRVSYLRETIRILRAEAFRIAFPDPKDLDKPNHRTRLAALDFIAKLDHRQATLEMDFGIFQRHLGQVDANVRHTLVDDAEVAAIAETMKKWGIHPPEPRKIEAGEAKPVESKETPHEPPKHEPAAAEPQPAPAPTEQRIIQPKLSGGFQLDS